MSGNRNERRKMAATARKRGVPPVPPGVAWRKTVAMARLTKQSVEIVVEYEAPSECAGRKLRLYYDPAADSEGHEWLD
jgi:hypothetical protein